jgi:hypothetical protein
MFSFRVILHSFCGALLLAALSASTVSAQTPADLCLAKQLGVAGKACLGTLKCYSKGAKLGQAVETSCLDDVFAKLGASDIKAESGGTCAHERLETPAFGLIGDLASDAAVDQLAYQSGGLCASKKLTATAKKCKAFFKCYSTARKQGNPDPDVACISAASEKFYGMFTTIESKLTCVPADKADEVETLVDVAVSDVFALYRDGLDTTTTTTTMEPPTTTTTMEPTTTTMAPTTTTTTMEPGNSPPSITSVSLTPSPAFETSTLTCTPNGASDPDLDTVTFSYAWTVNAAPIAPTTSTLNGSHFSKGDQVVCTVTPSDGIDSGAPVSSSGVTISNSAPSVASVSISPSTAYETTTLTCVPGSSSDIDGDTVIFFFEWRVQGVLQGVTASTLTGANFSSGSIVTCTATPTDGSNNGSPVTSGSRFIDNSPASLTSVSLTPTTAFESSTMVCTPNGFSDADGDSPTYQYFWEVNGSGVTGQHTSTLTGTYFNAGNSVDCYVFVGDGHETTPIAYVSNSVVIQ